MLTLSLGAGSGPGTNILCLGAHSDDIEIGCGGTILALLQTFGRVSVHWIVLAANQERAAEARMSAEKFLDGTESKTTVVKGFRDSFFPSHLAEIKDYFEELRKQVSPDLIFTHFRHDLHQDHRVVSELTWNTFRDHLILEYEIPKYDGDLASPNFFVPLEESVCNKKIQNILECFPSQRGNHWFDKETFLAILRLRGIESNAPSKFAEAFYSRKMVLG